MIPVNSADPAAGQTVFDNSITIEQMLGDQNFLLPAWDFKSGCHDTLTTVGRHSVMVFSVIFLHWETRSAEMQISSSDCEVFPKGV
jgi:hypothetical protein